MTLDLPLALELKERVALQAERTVTYIMHSHRLNGGMPRESEMVQLSLRAEYELERIPEELLGLAQDLRKKYDLSGEAAQHCV